MIPALSLLKQEIARVIAQNDARVKLGGRPHPEIDLLSRCLALIDGMTPRTPEPFDVKAAATRIVQSVVLSGISVAELTAEKELRALLDAGTSGWQPIETAPKDGTPVIAYAAALVHADFNPSGSVEAYWQDDEGWIGATWCAEHDNWHEKVIWPTHWMPKPAPPVDPETT